jgi:cytidylate kinase
MIIGICGLQSSGKDTLGNILVEKYGFKKLSFAGVLKDIVSILFGWPIDMVEGSTKESRAWREQVDEWWATRLQMPNLTSRYVL